MSPALDTDRLTLRPHRLEDFPDIHAMWSDPEVVRLIGSPPLTRSETWGKFLRSAGLWSILGYGYLVVRERASGRFVGQVGFADLLREIEPSIAGVPEAGWALATWAHGKGYAFEAVQALQSWFDATLGRQRTVCIIAPDNLPSLRLAGRCGYREVLRTTYEGRPIILLER